MSVQCVLIPPKLKLENIVSIRLSYDEEIEEIPELTLTVQEIKRNLSFHEKRKGYAVWYLSDVLDMKSCTQKFELTVGEKRMEFDLETMVFLGPTNSAKPPANLFLIEFVSGLYARAQDYTKKTVVFSLDSVMTLDDQSVRDLVGKQKQMEEQEKELSRKREIFAARLSSANLDLEKLKKLKAEYEATLRETRRVHHNYMLHNQEAQADLIRAQAERNHSYKVARLKNHFQRCLEAQTPQETDPGYVKLQKFRLIALEELKTIFPFVDGEETTTLCGVHYYQGSMTQSQWAETRAFLGFATQYLREVARVLGIALSYSVVPMAAASYMIHRMTREKKAIPAEYKPAQVASYEQGLVACYQHIANCLLIDDIDQFKDILECLRFITSLTEEQLKTLIPT